MGSAAAAENDPLPSIQEEETGFSEEDSDFECDTDTDILQRSILLGRIVKAPTGSRNLRTVRRGLLWLLAAGATAAAGAFGGAVLIPKHFPNAFRDKDRAQKLGRQALVVASTLPASGKKSSCLCDSLVIGGSLAAVGGAVAAALLGGSEGDVGGRVSAPRKSPGEETCPPGDAALPAASRALARFSAAKGAKPAGNAIGAENPQKTRAHAAPSAHRETGSGIGDRTSSFANMDDLLADVGGRVTFQGPETDEFAGHGARIHGEDDADGEDGDCGPLCSAGAPDGVGAEDWESAIAGLGGSGALLRGEGDVPGNVDRAAAFARAGRALARSELGGVGEADDEKNNPPAPEERETEKPDLFYDITSAQSSRELETADVEAGSLDLARLVVAAIGTALGDATEVPALLAKLTKGLNWSGAKEKTSSENTLYRCYEAKNNRAVLIMMRMRNRVTSTSAKCMLGKRKTFRLQLQTSGQILTSSSAEGRQKLEKIAAGTFEAAAVNGSKLFQGAVSTAEGSEKVQGAPTEFQFQEW